MKRLTHHLELTLGPGTSELSLRIGLHSGPVTAGVLRGEKSRFQLFGETMNTARRMESTGDAGKIHVSEETARLLKAGGKGYWLTKRQGTIAVKGKGEMQVGRTVALSVSICAVCSRQYFRLDLVGQTSS